MPSNHGDHADNLVAETCKIIQDHADISILRGCTLQKRFSQSFVPVVMLLRDV